MNFIGSLIVNLAFFLEITYWLPSHLAFHLRAYYILAKLAFLLFNYHFIYRQELVNNNESVNSCIWYTFF